MAFRLPLVLASGERQQLQSGDDFIVGGLTAYASGGVSIGTRTDPTDGNLAVLSVIAGLSAITVKNTSTSTAARSGLTAASDTATTNLNCHSSTRTATRYGVTLAGMADIFCGTGNGLLIGTSTNAAPIIFGTNGAERLRIFSGGGVSCGNTTDPGAAGRLNVTGYYLVADTQVVSTRKTGWTAATGTATRTSFATSTVTTANLAQAVKALIDDLIAHGLIGA